ncbi:MAG: anaerobic ribonucleoside-triphosphate reductase activating protein [Thermodesulfobacteriota bacterium]|nr:anaerobic ribonucleoside-triphosphate reductase activating protein [Thermodesulfobacteriota bacterium]
MEHHMLRPPIKGFVERSSTDWPGHSCAVVHLPYCNLRCPYCHSHELVLKPAALESFSFETIIQGLKSKNDSIYGICVTGGEPTMHRGLPGLLRTIREAGYRTKVDTNGTEPEVLEHLIEHRLLDLVAMDVKAPLDEATYERCAGVFLPVSIIEKSIEVITTAGVPHLFRCTVVPSLLAEDDIYRLADELKTLVAPHGAPSLTLQNFDPTDPFEPALKDVEPFTKETLSRMQERVNHILD